MSSVSMADQFSHDDKSNLWKEILNEVSASTSRRLPSNKIVLVLGDDGSGKTTLLNKLRPVGEDAVRKGAGLEYTYLDVADEDRDELTRLGVWILNGDPCHRNLLKFVLNAQTISNTLVLIVVDLSKPWITMDCISMWTRVLRDHINSLKLAPKVLNDLEAAVQKQFQEYVEPDTEEELLWKATREEDRTVLPLGENTLINNLGVPVVVVGTKADSLATLEKESYYRDEHFDFIQLYLRKFCLKYGAGLVYTSVKDNTNCSLLYKYMSHMLYRLPFRQQSQVIDRDSVFIPIGWDADSKISIVSDQLKTFSPNDRYEDVIAKPPPRKLVSQEKEVHVDEEAAFLSSLEVAMSKEPVTQSQVPAKSIPMGVTRMPLSGVAAVTRPSDRRLPTTAATTEGVKVGLSAGASEGTLANFFNSLLNKKGSPVQQATRSGRVSDRGASDLDRAPQAPSTHQVIEGAPSTDTSFEGTSQDGN